MMTLKLLAVRIIYRLKGFFENPVELFKALGIESDDYILEIGCAIGYHSFALAKVATNGKIYAVDIWEEGLKHLKRKIKPGQNIEIIHSRAETVDLPQSSVDRIVCFDTLHEVPGFEDTLQKWIEFLKEGGTFCYRDPEISAQKIVEISRSKLTKGDTIKGVHIFVKS
ncbi:MAG: class I SAM-dependent methyltransferase [Candidatus Hodarchaeota archaeon]